MYIYLKYLNIVIDFLSSIFITKVKIIFWLNTIKNGIPFTKNMSSVINTSLWIFNSSLGMLTMSPDTWICFFLLVFPFKSATILPQIACEMSIYWNITGKSMIFWLWTTHLKYSTYGYPSFVYKVFLAPHR